MKLVAKQDIEVSAQKVFDRLTDFRSFERSAIRRGATVKRLDTAEQPGPGMSWEVAFSLRGKRRVFTVTLREMAAPETLIMDVKSDGILGYVMVDLVALSRTSTRMRVETEIRPQTLSTRLLVQSLRLARSNMQERFRKRLAEFAASVEGGRPPRRA